jgi:hypothetical protein
MTLKRMTSVGLKNEHYKADALILYCVDHRGKEALDHFIRMRGYKHYDLIQIPGGAKIFTDLGDKKMSYTSRILRWLERKIILGYMSVLLRLHHADLIIAITHVDCGACGGSAAFGIDKEEEIRAHTHGLMVAKEFLQEHFRIVPAEAYFIDYRGCWQVI